jgi:hypothetical protein
MDVLGKFSLFDNIARYVEAFFSGEGFLFLVGRIQKAELIPG